MGLEVGGGDHDPVRLTRLACQLGEDAVEHAQPTLPDETIIDCLVRPVILGSITPHQPMLDDVDDGRHNPAAIDPRNTVRQLEKRLDPAHLRFAQ